MRTASVMVSRAVVASVACIEPIAITNRRSRPITPVDRCSQSDPMQHITFVEDRAFNDVRYFISSEKLMKLGWEPKVGFDEGLQRTIDWYAKVSKDWWEVGTDSALAAHPVPQTASEAAPIK